MEIQENVSLSGFNTFKIGGCARYFVVIKNLDDLKQAIDFSEKNQLPVFVLGGGSNLLISDKGCEGLVLKMEMTGIEFVNEDSDEVSVVVGAGENWDDLVRITVEKKLHGIENLSHIPGGVGASVVQNIGAYGVEIKEVVDWVKVFDVENKKIKFLQKDECKFGYRDSIFKKPEGKNYIVLRVAINLNKEEKLNTNYKDIQNHLKEESLEKISQKELREIIIKIRSKKFPDLEKIGTAGSFFKNPIVDKEKLSNLLEKYPEIPNYENEDGTFKVSLAYILDKILGVKGLKKGNVGVYDNQPLVLVNYNNGTASEIRELAGQITKDVKEKTGLDIHPEVVMW